MFNSKNILLSLTVMLALSFAKNSSAQSFWINSYSEHDGLANSRVYDLAQDSLGQMWFATRGGISVYDGFEWKKYSVAEGLPGLSYSQIEIDDLGRIWVMPEYSTLRVSYFNGKKWTTLNPVKIPNFYNANTMKVNCNDTSKCVAIGSWSHGLAVYSQDSWHLISKKDGLPSNQINGLESWRGNFFVATEKGLSLIRNLQVNNKFAANLRLPSKRILGIFIENKKENDLAKLKIWLIGSDWVGYVVKGKFTLVSKQIKSVTDDYSKNLTLVYDGNHGLYYGNMKSLRFLDIEKQTNQFLGKKNGLISEGVISLLRDREGNIWTASLRGVSKITSLRFANYTKDHGLLEDEVTAIAAVGSNQIVFGHNRGLTFFDGRRFAPIAFNADSLLPETMMRVLDLAVDRDKNVWAACSYFGIVKANANSGVVLHIPESHLPENVNSIVFGKNGKLYFSAGHYFCRMNSDFQSYKVIRIFKNTILRKLFLLPDGSIALATKGRGLLLYHHGRFSAPISYDKKLDNVFSVLSVAENSFLLGTIHGLFRVNDSTYEAVKFNGETINRPVYSILKDGFGRIWFGSDNGLFRWDGFNLRHFTTNNGFVGQEINRSAALVDAEGDIWFGSDRGVSCFREQYDFRFDDIPLPRVEIISANANDHYFSPFKDKSLAYNDNNLEFRFRAISFINEQENYFRYKIDGLADNWSQPFVSKDHLIRFTNLSPGSYRFYLQSRNALDVWSDIVSTGKITINEPYWMKWWFYLILFAIIAMPIVGTIIILFQRRYSRQLEEKVEQRTEEKFRAQALLTAAIEQTPAGILIADAPHGHVKIANSAALRILGIKDKESANLTSELGPENWKLYTEEGEEIKPEDFPLTQAVKEGNSVENQILVYRKKNGEQHWMYVNAAPVHDKKGKIIAGVMVFQDITELKKAEDQIKASLHEKDVLIKEIHHRVKNNLQVVSSLLYLQSKKITDETTKNMFNDSRDRIKSIALVHEKMYRSENFSQVNFADYIRSLSHSLYQVHHVDPGKVDFRLELDKVPLSMEQAIPCGLIVNELISNSLKYAFPKSMTKPRKIEIKIKEQQSGMVELIVRDNGVGLPKDFDVRKTDSLGLKLVATLTENQLDGELKIDRRHGTKFTIRFKTTA